MLASEQIHVAAGCAPWIVESSINTRGGEQVVAFWFVYVRRTQLEFHRQTMAAWVIEGAMARRREPYIEFPRLHLRIVFRHISHPVTMAAAAATVHRVLCSS